MRNLVKVLLAAGLISALAASTGHSQTNGGPTVILNAVWSLYENSPALFEGLAPSGSGSNVYSVNIVGYVNGALRAEPISGTIGLYYNWALATFPGDVVLREPQTGLISDLLRFDGQGGVYFFSELEPGEANPDMADVPQLPAPINPVVLDEIGPEGNNLAFYTPLAGQPGFDLSGVLPGVSYKIISDVPEPGTAFSVLTGLALWGFGCRRRKGRV